jgi:hypothetical protein
MWTYFEWLGGQYRTNPDASVIERLAGSTWSRTGSANVRAAALQALGRPAPARDGAADAQQAYRGYLISGPSLEGLFYISKNGAHIATARSLEVAKKEVDGLV